MKAKARQIGAADGDVALVAPNSARRELPDSDIPKVGDWFYVADRDDAEKSDSDGDETDSDGDETDSDGDETDDDEADDDEADDGDTDDGDTDDGDTDDDIGGDPEGEVNDWLGCVVTIGSNYFEMSSVAGGTTRIHSDKFWSQCTRAHDAEETIKAAVAAHRANVQKLMTEIQAVTARLHIGPKAALKAGDETMALSVQNGMGPIGKYKKDLIKAKEKTLPELFAKIENETKSMATWMKAALIPLKAEAKNTKSVLDVMEDRIFSVELYAGLVEEMTCIQEGKPANVDEKLHLFQRRCYMDEECLAAYETGGMDIKNLKAFERWLCRPANLNRILPFERCMTAFQVRRNTKEREAFDIQGFFKILGMMESDKYTFLYIRNGAQVYRLQTGIEFDEQLFPDIDHRISDNDKLWAKIFADTFRGNDHDSLISDGHYQDKVKKEAEKAAKAASMPEEERWKYTDHWPDSRHYVEYTRESVFYDDISQYLQDQIKKHNRIVLILQGILDRSPALHPHPPWQLWTEAGFSSALVLHHDDSRALSDGDKPDFEAYRAGVNASLAVGSVTVGQEDAWERVEAARECARIDRSWRSRDRSYRPTHFRPYGNPGPGTLAVVEKKHRDGKCTYTWTRERQRHSYKDGDPRCHVTVASKDLLNADAYRPGDFHKFFDDPRTRAEYLKWAPLLLEAEEYQAGNRKLKPKGWVEREGTGKDEKVKKKG